MCSRFCMTPHPIRCAAASPTAFAPSVPSLDATLVATGGMWRLADPTAEIVMPSWQSELRRSDEPPRVLGEGLAAYGLPGEQHFFFTASPASEKPGAGAFGASTPECPGRRIPERPAGHGHLLSGAQGEQSVLVDGCAADPGLDARHGLPSLIHRPKFRAAPRQNHLVLPPPEFPTPGIGLVFQQTKDHDAPVRLNV